MAKQIKVDSKKKAESAKPERLVTRSPLTNLFFAVLLGLVYLFVFDGGQGALLYAVGAFLFFNTVDYCILYYRLNKKENK